MLAPPVRVHARFEADIGTIVSRYDRLGVVAKEFGWEGAVVFRGAEFVLLIMQSSKPIGRVNRRSATPRSRPVEGMVNTEAHGREWTENRICSSEHISQYGLILLAGNPGCNTPVKPTFWAFETCGAEGTGGWSISLHQFSAIRDNSGVDTSKGRTTMIPANL
jgi:hypothetical protein